jgi:hypothetical protein
MIRNEQVTERELTVIGRAEKIALPDLGVKNVPAKVDTGADSSSIWAHVARTDGSELTVVFFAPGSKFYDGCEHRFGPDDFVITRVANSFGDRELRYKIKLIVKVNERLINGTFTLSDRSNKLYPILIGRSLLANKFLVDVASGKPLRRQERERTKKLREELVDIKEIKNKETSS